MIYSRRLLGIPLLVAQCFLAIFAASCFAQEQTPSLKIGDSVTQQFKIPPKDGEFRKETSSGVLGIGCARVVQKEEAPFSNGAPDYGYCLRVGPMILGMEFYRLQMALSNLKQIPETNITNARIVNVTEDGVRTVLIPITTQVINGQTHLLSYLVVLMNSKGVVGSIQLTGKANFITENLPFSSITLGASKERVVDILGYPSVISDVPDIKGKLWSYAPFPITIEFVNGVVYSVRINIPNESDKRKAFKPLASVSE